MSLFGRKQPQIAPYAGHYGCFNLYYLCIKHAKIPQLTKWVYCLIIIGHIFYFGMKLAAQDAKKQTKVGFGLRSLLWSHTTVIVPHWNTCKIGRFRMQFTTPKLDIPHTDCISTYWKCPPLSKDLQKNRASPDRFFAIGPRIQILPDPREPPFGSPMDRPITTIISFRRNINDSTLCSLIIQLPALFFSTQ